MRMWMGDSVAEVQRRIRIYARSLINGKMLILASDLSTPVWDVRGRRRSSGRGTFDGAGESEES
jgi:hypothetical protein